MPDLVTTAKGLGGGMPLAAVTGRADVMDTVHAGGIGGTYSGNPVACEAALGVFETIETRDLLARARDIGDIFYRELDAIAAGTDVVGEIRGRGAMVAVELVTGADKTPNRDAVAEVARYARPTECWCSPPAPSATFCDSCRHSTISDQLLLEGLGVIRDAVAGL